MRSTHLPASLALSALVALVSPVSAAPIFTGLGDLPGAPFSSFAQGLSSDGSVAVGQGVPAASSFEGFRWTSGGGMVGLGDLSGGSFNSVANAISSDGATIVGRSSSASGFEAFRWTAGGGLVGLGHLQVGATESIAYGVSADGSQIVGHSRTASVSEAFVWDAVHGMRKLKDVLTTDFGLGASLVGWQLTNALALSADGKTFAGYGTNPSGFSEAWIATIPEPSTALLLGLGLAGVALRGRHRKA